MADGPRRVWWQSVRRTHRFPKADLEQDLDEDSGGGGGVVLGEADALHDLPADGVLLQQRRKELGHVAQLVGLQAVDQRVLPPEALLEALLVRRELQREAGRQQCVVPEGPATFQQEPGNV